MIDQDSDVRALRREWLAARVIAVLVVVVLVGLGTVVILGWWQGAAPPRQAPAPAALPSPSDITARREEGVAICSAALATVQKLGLVPQFATLDGGDTKATGVQGRYVCAAKTDAARYAVTFDLTCTNLGAGNCIAPYSIVQDGNAVIYKRS